MKRLLGLFDPRRIAGQIALLVVLAVVVVQLIFFGIVVARRPVDADHPGRPLQDRFAAVLRIIEGAPSAAARATVLETVGRAMPFFRFEQAEPNETVTDETRPVLDRIRLQSGVASVGLSRAQPASPGRDFTRLVATLTDGQRVAGVLDLRDGRPPEATIMLVGALIFIAVTLGLLSLWAARALTSPLTSFAAAARDFSLDTASSPLREDGPREVRVAARALNRMQARIRRLVEDRTRMLAAISHDLRTPITRLRLRAEFVSDEAVRGPMLRDLDQMDAMTSGALAFLSPGGAAEEAPGRVDLSALLATVADDFAEIGHEVTFAGTDRVVVPGRTDELVRAVTNLVENALRYAGRAAIVLRPFPGVVEIDVADDGPGIPAGDRAALLRPFARGDAARTLDGSTGFGLGLSIAHSVAERHGGRLSLLDAEPQGLLARITLPREPQAAPGFALAAE